MATWVEADNDPTYTDNRSSWLNLDVCTSVWVNQDSGTSKWRIQAIGGDGDTYTLVHEYDTDVQAIDAMQNITGGETVR